MVYNPDIQTLFSRTCYGLISDYANCKPVAKAIETLFLLFRDLGTRERAEYGPDNLNLDMLAQKHEKFCTSCCI